MRQLPFVRTRVAEHVLPGHPDKLADAVADALVQEARARQGRALVGVEVALYRDVVFVDGRIGCRRARSIDVEGVVRRVFASAGYGREWEPAPETLRIVTKLDLGPLAPGEAAFRAKADDQSIVTGYATTRNEAGLPPEHLLSWTIARSLWELRSRRPDLGLGPDGKVMVAVREDDGAAIPSRISVSQQGRGDGVERRKAIGTVIRDACASVLDFGARDIAQWVDVGIHVNGAGDFEIGGPMGDNGLSGKKLAADAYGPRVPIGGGATSGKDFHKADRAGAVMARRAALAACRRHGMRDATVTLAIEPGASAFRVMSVETPDGRILQGMDEVLPPAASSLGAFGDSVPSDLAVVELARWGHFTPHPEARRLVEGPA